MAALTAAGCGQKPRAYTSTQAIEALKAQAGQVRTCRGRAWLSAKSPEQKISFPAVIAVDRTDPAHPLLRLEAIDLVGVTHALMLVDAKRSLRWVDFDDRRVYELKASWHGLPLEHLPGLLLGLGEFPEGGVPEAADADGFAVRSPSGLFRYLVSWIDPGPRVALSGLEGNLAGARERYAVRMSKFMDTQDFYLPQELDLRGFERAGETPAVEVHVAWRERRWNEDIPSAVFALPEAAVGGFRR